MSSYQDPRERQRIGLGILGVTVAVTIGLLWWGLTSETKDPWVDVCRPAIDDRLRATGPTDYSMADLRVQVRGDKSVRATGLVESEGLEYTFTCELGTDLEVVELDLRHSTP